MDINTGTSTCSYGVQPCAHRLPCGICRLMQCQCPKYFNAYEVTCTSTNATNVASAPTVTLTKE